MRLFRTPSNSKTGWRKRGRSAGCSIRSRILSLPHYALLPNSTFNTGYLRRGQAFNLITRISVSQISGQCWEAAGYHKAQMMKGHSKMYADRIAAIPPGEDVWRY